MSFPPLGFIMESILLSARGGPGLINTEHLQGQHSLPARALESCQGQDDSTGKNHTTNRPHARVLRMPALKYVDIELTAPAKGFRAIIQTWWYWTWGTGRLTSEIGLANIGSAFHSFPSFTKVLKVPKKNLDYLPSWTNSAEMAGWGLGKSNLCIFLTLVMSISPSSPSFSAKAGISQPEFRLSLLLLYLFPTPLPPLQGIRPCQGMAAMVPPISVTLTL